MKYLTIILMLLPALLSAQEFQFRQEFDTIPVEINGRQPFQPWFGGFSQSSPDFVDLDSDGDLDFLVGQASNAPIPYFKNLGNSASPEFVFFILSDSLKSVDEFGHTNPDCFDLDADGDFDILVGSGFVTYVENLGTIATPDFNAPRLQLFDTQGNWIFGTHVALIDIDLDDDGDLIGGEYQGHLQFYRNIGTPDSFAFYLESDLWLGIDVGDDADPTFCDIDADGDYDLFIGSRDGNIWYYRNDGDSLNYNFTYVTDFYDSIWVDYCASPEFADIDGDGDYDLFVGRDNYYNPDSPGDLFYYENIGNASEPQWQLIRQNYLSLDQGYKSQNHHADIDADGDADLFSANFNNRISFYQNIGNSDSAEFLWITDAYQDIAVNGDYIFFDDIDADQDSDLFIGEVQIPNPPYPSLYLFQNRGTPQNAQFTYYSNNLVPGNIPVGVLLALADIDQDGDQDLFITNGSNDIRNFYENIGSPTEPVFASPTMGWFGAFPPTPFGYLPSFCFYDIDNDGDLDLFGVPHGLEVYNWVWFYRNIGTAQNPSFALVTQNLVPLDGEDSFMGIDIFDIDDDGDGDVLLSTTYRGGMMFFRNITGEASAPPPVYRHPQAGLQISLGPNPANPLVAASFELRVASNMSLEVYDLLGRRIAELASGFHLPGEYRYVWDASKNASGIYIIRLETPQQSLSEKMTIIK